MQIKKEVKRYAKNPSYLIRDQHHITPLIGAVKITYTNTAPYINFLNFLMISAILWYTSAAAWSVRYIGFSVTYPGFVLILLSGLALFGIIVYKFDMPSSMRFWFDQLFRHATLLPARLDEMEANIIQSINSNNRNGNRIDRAELRRARHESKYKAQTE